MAFEVFYSVREIASSLSMSEDYVRRRIELGEFGPVVFLPGGDLRVPSSGCASFLSRGTWIDRPLKEDPGPREPARGVAARTPGELRRKVSQAARAPAPADPWSAVHSGVHR